MALPKISFAKGDSHFIEDETQLPFTPGSYLGNGLCGYVERVANADGNEYARKRFQWENTKSKRSLQRSFNKEMEIIKSLEKHHHIIEVFASYTSPKEFALLLSPVADGGDLNNFLSIYWKLAEETETWYSMRTAIQKSFGCLANGLDFLHRNKIKHRDIKPANILMHKGSVVYTDFGYARDHSGASNSISRGRPEAFTRDYAAPEVVNYGTRDSTSDVYSLGCVFLDLLSADLGNKALSRVERRLQELEDTLNDPALSTQHYALAALISSMLAFNRSDRPKADQVSIALAAEQDFCCSLCKVEMEALFNQRASEQSQDQPQERSGWVWSEAHQDYYYAVPDEHGTMMIFGSRSLANTLAGAYIYHWARAETGI
jgi:serine/threonine protein kinase